MLPSERTNFPSPSRPPPPPSQDRPTHPDQPEPRSPHRAAARSGRGRTGAARAAVPPPTTPAERAWACAARAPHPRHPPTGRRTGNPSRRASAARRARTRASRRVRRWEERGVCVIACSQSPPRGPLCAHPRPTTTPTPRLYPQRHPTPPRFAPHPAPARNAAPVRCATSSLTPLRALRPRAPSAVLLRPVCRSPVCPFGPSRRVPVRGRSGALGRGVVTLRVLSRRWTAPSGGKPVRATRPARLGGSCRNCSETGAKWGGRWRLAYKMATFCDDLVA